MAYGNGKFIFNRALRLTPFALRLLVKYKKRHVGLSGIGLLA